MSVSTRTGQDQNPYTRADLHKYLVVGVDIGNDQRYADYFFACDPGQAEEMAHQEIEEIGGGLLVAAVLLNGQIIA